MASSLSDEIITGDGRTLTIEDIVQQYRNTVNLSVPTKGRIQRLDNNVFSMTNKFSTVDCDTFTTLNTCKVYSMTTKPSGRDTKCIDTVLCVSDPFNVSEVASATSENGRFVAKLKSPSKPDTDPDVAPKQLLEIWDRSRLLKTIDLSEFDTHGAINTDYVFSNFAWTKAGDQDKLLYVCQPKRVKKPSFFKESKLDKNDGDISKNPTLVEGYVKKEDWGECLNGIEHTMVAVMDVSNNFQVSLIDIEGFSLGDPHWLDNGHKVVCVSYPENPRRLGLVYCPNRPTKLVVYDWQSISREPILELKSSSLSYHTPRVSNSGDKFIFLTNLKFGAHEHSVNLSLYDFNKKSLRSLTVDLSGIDLFVENLPDNCFTADDKYILFVSNDHLSQNMYLYSLETESVKIIKFPYSAVSILDFRYDLILASGSSVDATPTLFVAALNPSDISDVVAWHQIEECFHLDDVRYEQVKIPTQDKTTFISALFIKPDLSVLQSNLNEKTVQSKNILITSQNQLPTVVIVHGGPHSNFVTRYTPIVLFYTRLGLNVILVNYRGSLGVTEEYVQSLCGNIGIMDVEDSLEAIRYFVQNKSIDSRKLIIQGGSHGGLLSCHLSCQDEFKFTSAIIRNPVVDLITMIALSDIPDWITAEGLDHRHYDASEVFSGDDLIKLRLRSASFKSHKAHVPTLMLLGSRDRRVPMFQGERWVDILNARGIETLCKIYNDNHSLSKPETAADSALTAAIWILNHLPK